MDSKKKKIIMLVVAICVVIAVAVGLILLFNNTQKEEAEKETNNMDGVEDFESSEGSTNGRIELFVVDQDNLPVVDSTIRLEKLDGTLVGDVETGTDGKIVYYNVAEGDYILTQLEVGEGYIKKEEPVKTTVKRGETSSVEIKNERITGKIVITAANDANEPLAEVQFNLYDAEGYLMDTLKTDQEGKVTANVGYGVYYFKQSSNVEGTASDDTMYRVTVDAENRTFKQTVTSIRNKGTLMLTVTDEEGNNLQNVKFIVVDSEGNVIQSITTNELGRAGVANIPYGSYYYQQAAVPEGFKIDSEKHEFRIIENNQTMRKTIVMEKE